MVLWAPSLGHADPPPAAPRTAVGHQTLPPTATPAQRQKWFYRSGCTACTAPLHSWAPSRGHTASAMHQPLPLLLLFRSSHTVQHSISSQHPLTYPMHWHASQRQQPRQWCHSYATVASLPLHMTHTTRRDSLVPNSPACCRYYSGGGCISPHAFCPIPAVQLQHQRHWEVFQRH